MDDRDLDRFNELWNGFLSGLPWPLQMTRSMLLVLFLLEELHDSGRDALRLLETWIMDFERSKREPASEDEEDC